VSFASDGKVRITRRIAISKDGKTMTVAAKGLNAQEKKVIAEPERVAPAEWW
jgi:hypothetical protein